ncbi:MAG: sulfotransferase family protein [Actinomycetota bacterium]
MTVRINLWSSPRNVSTAMMYAWRQRPDTTVIDEPLYAHALDHTGRIHPGRDEILASQDTDGSRVISEVILGPSPTPILFCKQMAKHLVGLDRGFLADCRNVLLTREPKDMLTSFQKQIPDTTLADTGLTEMVEILDAAVAAGQEPIVVDSRRLLADPPAVLAELCRRLEVPYDDAMLHWPPGPKPEDGVWAPYWYEAVHRSTGWAPWRAKDDRLLPHLEPVLAQSEELYERLLPYAIG